MAAHMTRDQRQMVLRLRERGLSVKAAARAAGVHFMTIYNLLEGKGKREADPHRWQPATGRLTLAEREEITVGLTSGDSCSVIARRLGRSPSTVSREVAANGGHHDYRAWAGYLRAERCSRRPKASKIGSHPQLRDQVSQWLSELWSPEEITRRLRIEFPDDPMMWVSHETIYKSLFVQGPGRAAP